MTRAEEIAYSLLLVGKGIPPGGQINRLSNEDLTDELGSLSQAIAPMQWSLAACIMLLNYSGIEHNEIRDKINNWSMEWSLYNRYARMIPDLVIIKATIDPLVPPEVYYRIMCKKALSQEQKLTMIDMAVTSHWSPGFTDKVLSLFIDGLRSDPNIEIERFKKVLEIIRERRFDIKGFDSFQGAEMFKILTTKED